MLITDTVGDVRDALAAGIRVVGVAWGMHGVDELTEAGAEFVALGPQELAAYLLGDAGAAGPVGSCAVPTAGAGTAGQATASQSCGCGGACGEAGGGTGPAAAGRQPAHSTLARSNGVPDDLLSRLSAGLLRPGQ